MFLLRLRGDRREERRFKTPPLWNSYLGKSKTNVPEKCGRTAHIADHLVGTWSESGISEFQSARRWFAPDIVTEWGKSCFQLGLRNSQVNSWRREMLTLWE